MKRHLAYALLASPLLASTMLPLAADAAAPQRLRGTITSISGDTVHVKTTAGADATVTLAADTRVATVSKASLADIKPGTFIGTATKGSGDYLTALEVVIFPEAMRGTGEGHYPWDRITDTTAGGAHSTSSAMTNGNVSAALPAGGTANSSMTNGNVSAASGAGGAQKLTVTYKGGQQTIIVPPTAPVVLIHPADRSALANDDKLFAVVVKEGAAFDAKLVVLGSGGVAPPM